MARTRNFLLIFILVLQSCATLPTQSERMMMSAGAGAAVGSAGGVIFSPNRESKGMNALVFGLSGALIGAAVGLLLPSPTDTSTKVDSLEDKERASSIPAHEFTVSPNGELPAFLKRRVSPAVVEEFIESDQIGEDGSLHAPHKVYRIKHPTELIAIPNQADSSVN